MMMAYKNSRFENDNVEIRCPCCSRVYCDEARIQREIEYANVSVSEMNDYYMDLDLDLGDVEYPDWNALDSDLESVDEKVIKADPVVVKPHLHPVRIPTKVVPVEKTRAGYKAQKLQMMKARRARRSDIANRGKKPKTPGKGKKGIAIVVDDFVETEEEKEKDEEEENSGSETEMDPLE